MSPNPAAGHSLLVACVMLPQEWFNMFCIHQNHATGRGTKNHIPESFLPGFLVTYIQTASCTSCFALAPVPTHTIKPRGFVKQDFVLWGHEHECLIDPTLTGHGYFVTQPGSSVATSLIEGEVQPYIASCSSSPTPAKQCDLLPHSVTSGAGCGEENWAAGGPRG